MKKNLMLMFTLLAVGACSAKITGTSVPPKVPVTSDPTDMEIPNIRLSGNFGGARWVMAQGVARISPLDPTMLALSFSDQTQSASCPLVLSADHGVLTQVPMQAGNHILGQAPNRLTATFATLEGGQIRNEISQLGRVVISEISADTVKGAVLIWLNDSTQVAGHFEIPLCSTAAPRDPMVATPPPAPLPGLTDRFLKEDVLKASASGGYNTLRIDEPRADRVYADFKFEPTGDVTLSFDVGTTSANCSASILRRHFEIIRFDDRGQVIDSKFYDGYPSRLTFKASERYVVRHLVTNFPEWCTSLSTSFVARGR